MGLFGRKKKPGTAASEAGPSGNGSSGAGGGFRGADQGAQEHRTLRAISLPDVQDGLHGLEVRL